MDTHFPGSFECGNEISATIKCAKFLDWMVTVWHLKMDCVVWSDCVCM